MVKPKYRVGDIVIPTHKPLSQYKFIRISDIEPNWNNTGLYHWEISYDLKHWCDYKNNTELKHFEDITTYYTKAARILYGR